MKSKFILTPLKSDRRELDVNLLVVALVGLVVTIAIYLLFLPFRQTFLGILIYERGLTQPLVIFLAAVVGTLTLFKFFKVRREIEFAKQEVISPTISFKDPLSKQVIDLQQSLAREPNLIARRCSRIVAAYIQSGDRQSAGELAMDDSSFYQNSSETSYTIPKILIWAIPLLGFIGTVVGISASVGGFTGFLENANDIDQIKEGIGTVTNGLAIAFDTTLLALCMSIAAMLPLVMVERMELRLLLAIDVFINDRLLPRLSDGEKTENSLSLVGNEQFMSALTEQIKLNQAIVEKVQFIMESMDNNHLAIAEGIRLQTEKIIEQLQQVDSGLEEKVSGFTQQVAQLNNNLTNLREKDTLEEILEQLKISIDTLKPVLEEGNKPRRIILVEELKESPIN